MPGGVRQLLCINLGAQLLLGVCTELQPVGGDGHLSAQQGVRAHPLRQLLPAQPLQGLLPQLYAREDLLVAAGVGAQSGRGGDEQACRRRGGDPAGLAAPILVGLLQQLLL